MLDYLKNTIAKTVSNSLISLAGYVGGYSLVDPSDKHGVKSSHLICKGKIICIPFYYSGHCCQVYLNFDRTNFEEVACGVLFPDGKIIDISTGCPGLEDQSIDLESFGPGCRLIWSDSLPKFPKHLDEMTEEDYYLEDSESVETYDSESIETSNSSEYEEESIGETEELYSSNSAEEVSDSNSDLIEN
jgi:hypothetical protein